jgi:hypothetical protein
MKVLSFESFEDLANYISSNEETAKVVAGQKEGLLKVLTHGTYFASIRPDLELVIFGEVLEHTKYPEDTAGILARRVNGYIFGRCYSVLCHDGELGDTHVGNITCKITKQVFDRARANGWRHIQDTN